MDKKKVPFFRLSITFIAIILAALFFSWGYQGSNGSQTGMMGQSMGEMMGGSHLKEVTIRDLITREEQSETIQEEEHSQHHNSEGSFLNTIHKVTTLTIVVFIPFLIAGTVFLFIIWFDKK